MSWKKDIRFVFLSCSWAKENIKSLHECQNRPISTLTNQMDMQMTQYMFPNVTKKGKKEKKINELSSVSEETFQAN